MPIRNALTYLTPFLIKSKSNILPRLVLRRWVTGDKTVGVDGTQRFLPKGLTMDFCCGIIPLGGDGDISAESREDDHICSQIILQIVAVWQALTNCGRIILKDHMGHSIHTAV